MSWRDVSSWCDQQPPAERWVCWQYGRIPGFWRDTMLVSAAVIEPVCSMLLMHCQLSCSGSYHVGNRQDNGALRTTIQSVAHVLENRQHICSHLEAVLSGTSACSAASACDLTQGVGVATISQAVGLGVDAPGAAPASYSISWAALQVWIVFLDEPCDYPQHDFSCSRVCASAATLPAALSPYGLMVCVAQLLSQHPCSSVMFTSFTNPDLR